MCHNVCTEPARQSYNQSVYEDTIGPTRKSIKFPKHLDLLQSSIKMFNKLNRLTEGDIQ